MKKRAFLLLHAAIVLGLFFFQGALVAAHDNVVVVPLGGIVGNATATDVIKGKTFSSKAAGKGTTGTLKIREGSTIYTNSIGMDFSLIPAGSFVMGSPDGSVSYWPDENGWTDEDQHLVTLTKPFYMQTTEVTQGQWEQVMGANPSFFTSCGSTCPVEQVSWDDAQNFIDTLNSLESRYPCSTPPNCYSLPTESQWEYAARGGTVTAFHNGDITNTDYTDCTPLDPILDTIGWYCGNSNSTTHPVAQKAPNNWGLHDMSGNVYEWCQDWYGDYPPGPETDPSGPASGSSRVIRGGSYKFSATISRSAYRIRDLPTSLYRDQGFRLALPTGQ